MSSSHTHISLIVNALMVNALLFGCDDSPLAQSGSGCESLNDRCPEGSACAVDALGNPYCAPQMDDPPLVTPPAQAGESSAGDRGGEGGPTAGSTAGETSGGQAAGETSGGQAAGETSGGQAAGETSGVSAAGALGGATELECTSLELGLKPSGSSAPQVMLVVDRSYSMINREDRWGPALSAIDQVTRALEESVHFGLALFPAPFRGAPDPGELSLCQMWGRGQLLCEEDLEACTPGQVLVEPALRSSTMIRESLDAHEPRPNQGTPTHSAIDAAAEALDRFADQSAPKVIILVTDGLPGCNARLNPTECDCTTGLPFLCETDRFATACLDDLRVVERVAELATQGVRTLIVGITIGSPSEGACISDNTCPFGGQRCVDGQCVNLAPVVLSEIARAGGDATGSYFSVTDVGDIEAQVTRATASVAPCVFDVSEIPPELYQRLAVYIDGELIMRDAEQMNGWWVEDGALSFSGAACDLLRDGESHRVAARCE